MTSFLFCSLLPAAKPALSSLAVVSRDISRLAVPAAGQLAGRAQAFPVNLLFSFVQSSKCILQSRRRDRHSSPQARSSAVSLNPLSASVTRQLGGFSPC